jgi:hypothetical protein
MKRLVLWAATAVVSSTFFAVAADGTAFAGAAAPAAVANGAFLPAPGHARIHAARGLIVSQSTNWSGYVQAVTTRHTFTAVTDTFVVPTVVSSTSGTQYAADWVGIGGFDQHPRDVTLVQTGIQTQVTTSKGHRKVAYDAWTEILPQAEKPLTLTLSVGDTVTASVEETAKNTWVMTVDDVTTGESAGRTVKYHAKGLSAEAIHERPCIAAPCNSVTDLAELAQTSDVIFDPGSFSEAPPGTPPVDEPLLTTTVAGATLTAVQMLGNDGVTPIATPSGPDTAEDGFTVADGAAQPPPPTV